MRILVHTTHEGRPKSTVATHDAGNVPAKAKLGDLFEKVPGVDTYRAEVIDDEGKAIVAMHIGTDDDEERLVEDLLAAATDEAPAKPKRTRKAKG